MIKWSRGGQWDCGTASNERCYRLRVLLLGKQWISGLQWRWPFQLLEYQLGRGGWVDLIFDLIWFDINQAQHAAASAQQNCCHASSLAWLIPAVTAMAIAIDIAVALEMLVHLKIRIQIEKNQYSNWNIAKSYSRYSKIVKYGWNCEIWPKL